MKMSDENGNFGQRSSIASVEFETDDNKARDAVPRKYHR